MGEAENSCRGIELAARLKPDVLLLDIRMPQLDGLTVLEELHSPGQPSDGPDRDDLQ
ncbi:response regulator [Glutamicibacter protophormiae]|uniref:response regulator n=1 Tax=Glutamicibacter protophormiae TaxID=37930 RepID=UPI002A81D773|nr:response regulator [Glutamicibacter protophormiae]WPR66055.1 response regulator [Glutamicibacter protophormiae]WPR69552.1 response regulator [Glutamicibacter protophormiae]